MTISAGSACHSCSTHDTIRVGASAGTSVSRELALDGQRGEHRLADGGGGVLLGHAPGVGDPQLPDPELGGREQPLDQRQHVVALAAQCADLPQRRAAVAALQRGEVAVDLVGPDLLEGHDAVTRGSRLDGEDGDVVVRPVLQVRGERDGQRLDLRAGVARADVLQHRAEPVLAEPGAAAGGLGDAVGVEQAGLAGRQPQLHRGVARAGQQPQHGPRDGDLLDPAVAPHDQRRRMARRGDVEQQVVAVALAAAADRGDEGVDGCRRPAPGCRARGWRRVPVDEGRGAHALPDLAGEHGRLDALAADVAHHHGPLVVVAVHVVEVAADGLVLEGHAVVGHHHDAGERRQRRRVEVARQHRGDPSRVGHRTGRVEGHGHLVREVLEERAPRSGRSRRRRVARRSGRRTSCRARSARWSARPSAGSLDSASRSRLAGHRRDQRGAAAVLAVGHQHQVAGPGREHPAQARGRRHRTGGQLVGGDLVVDDDARGRCSCAGRSDRQLGPVDDRPGQHLQHQVDGPLGLQGAGEARARRGRGRPSGRPPAAVGR